MAARRELQWVNLQRGLDFLGFVRLVSRRFVVFEDRVPIVYIASLSRWSSTVPLTFYSGTGVG